MPDNANQGNTQSEVEKIVVSFDICSSSTIIEDLILRGKVHVWLDLLNETKRFLTKYQMRLELIIYKFTGDGWILLLSPSIPRQRFFTILSDISKDFEMQFASHIVPELEIAPQVTGITFGADLGKLQRLDFGKGTEYVGRAINVACRLQNAIKDGDPKPGHKVLLSGPLYRSLPGTLTGYQPKEVSRSLRNIKDGSPYPCIMVDLLMVDAKVTSTSKPRIRFEPTT